VVAGNKANDIDVQVGARVKLRRKLLGLTQGALASALGVTFQQIQKYENGSNRIGASRLFDLAKVLQVDAAFLFAQSGDGTSDNLPRDLRETDEITSFLETKEGLEINRAFATIKDPKTRRSIVALMNAIANGDVSDHVHDLPSEYNQTILPKLQAPGP
jgi:transcriptional regulator with XRE-family HTH domain